MAGRSSSFAGGGGQRCPASSSRRRSGRNPRGSLGSASVRRWSAIIGAAGPPEPDGRSERPPSHARQEASDMEPGTRTAVGMPPGRLLTLADGIFAIAMTLLVLDLRLPDAPAGDLATRLRSLIPRFGTFVVSFVVLGVFWFAHHQTFHFVVRVNRTLVWLSVLFFMGVALIPFVASVLGANYDDPIALTL